MQIVLQASANAVAEVVEQAELQLLLTPVRPQMDEQAVLLHFWNSDRHRAIQASVEDFLILVKFAQIYAEHLRLTNVDMEAQVEAVGMGEYGHGQHDNQAKEKLHSWMG